MDIPKADELEWLEANSHFDDEYYLEEEEHPTNPWSIEKEQAQALNQQFANLPNPEPFVFSSTSPGKKRPRSDEESVSGDEFSVSKRNTIAVERHNHDECSMLESILPGACPAVEEGKYLSRFAVEIDGDCMPVTGPSGERVYAKIDWEGKSSDVKKLNASTDSAHISGFSSQPINILLQKVEQDASMKALLESSVCLRPQAPVASEDLWVDKYSPKSFTELLSDERTNREVLLWLKQWDCQVFGDDVKYTGEEVLSALRRHSVVSYNQRHSDMTLLRRTRGSRLSEKQFSSAPTLDIDANIPKGLPGLQNRKPMKNGPLEKVLLLCGPPGIGKTTLAHVVAKHCGYHVVEINASDDRTSCAIETKILDAVQMNSILVGSKPKCLVIDEIDGALGGGKGAIDIILKMIAADKNSCVGLDVSAEEEKLGKKSSKKGPKSLSLSRPVICICNDLYAPALRPLRQVAKVLLFAQPTVNRVVSRIKYICNREGLKTSSVALTALADYTDCDIRSCLNTLQFLNKKRESLKVLDAKHSVHNKRVAYFLCWNLISTCKGSNPMNLITKLPVDVNSQVVGRKDTTRSIFDIWKEVFQKRRMKRSSDSNVVRTSSYDSPNNLYSLISHRGDYELLFDGIHENMLQLHYHDPLMQKTVRCLSSLGIADIWHQCVMRSHVMSLYAYHPVVAIMIHHQLGQVEKPIIEWPKSFQRCRTILTEKMEILRSWNTKIAPYISRHLSIRSLVEDTLSPLLHILSPPTLRPVALHLLSDKEKNDLAQLVGKLLVYNFSFKNVKAHSSNVRMEGSINATLLSFDPPIEDFMVFKGCRPSCYEIPSAMKHVLVHEVEKQRILHGSFGKFMHGSGCNEDNNAVGAGSSPPVAACAEHRMDRATNRFDILVHEPDLCKSSSTSASDNAALNPSGALKKLTRDSFGFFDRFKKLNGDAFRKVNCSAEKPTIERDSRPLLLKYNEGFTNAVKRPVRTREFLIP